MCAMAIATTKAPPAARVEELIQRARDVFAHRPEILSAYLFGSLAHDLAGPMSDVDLAIQRDPEFKEVESGWRTYWGDLHADLVQALGLADDQLDLVILDARTSSLLAHRATWRGRLIHCRDHRARVVLETRILQTYLDTAPLRRLIAEHVGIRGK